MKKKFFWAPALVLFLLVAHMHLSNGQHAELETLNVNEKLIQVADLNAHPMSRI